MSKSFATGPLLALGSAGILFVSLLNVSAAQKIRVYDIPKEETSHSHGSHQHGAAPSAQPGAADPHAGLPLSMPRVKWAKLPEGWKENPSPGQMRAASFIVTQGDNEGEVGAFPIGNLPNVEQEILGIWRAQLKLAPITETELESAASAVPVGDATGRLFEFASTEAVLGDKYKARMLVVSLKRLDANWFFKFAGEDAFVAGQRAAFLEFLKGLSFEAAQPPPSRPMASGGGMGAMQGGETIKAGTGPHPEWKVPASWTAVDHSSFLVAKFRVTGEGGAAADINVSSSAGTGGGLLPNVNRWRAQLNLGALNQAGLEKIATPIEVPAGKATLVDMSGSESENGGNARCVGIMVQLPEVTWFYKLAGTDTLVAREKEALLQFVRSVIY